MRRLLRRALRAFLIAALIGIPSAMAFGPLLPWSPIHPGYRELKLARGRILYPNTAALPAAYQDLDAIITQAERFHRLAATKPINVVIPRTWADFHRFAPWIRGRALGGLSLATGDAIFITPKLDEREFDHKEYLRHEVSHSLLAQNASLLDFRAQQQNDWLFEGIAVWFGEQRSYVSQAEFRERAPVDGIARSIVPQLRTGDFDIRFGYIAWRNFLDYLSQTRGHDIFLAFVHAANRDPGHLDVLFSEYFGTDFPAAAAEFESAVLAGDFAPQ